VKLLYFAWLRAKIGVAEEVVPLPPEVRDVEGLLDWLKSRGPGYREALAKPAAIRVAVNYDYVRRDHPLQDGDEVALFPPVTGG
jgi:molybdopterin synthase sulfur carrier subunit